MAPKTPIRLRIARYAISLAVLTVSPAALAGDGIFGTKTSPVSTTAAGTSMGPMPIAQMFVALLVVLGLLKWVLPLAVKKFNPKGMVSNKGILVHETATVGPGNVYVVEVRGKSLLIGATPNSMNLLADLTETGTPLKTFQEMVDESMPRPMTTQRVAMDDLLSQLDRLKTFDS